MRRPVRPVHVLASTLMLLAALPSAAPAQATQAAAADKARGKEMAGLVLSSDPRCRGTYAARNSGVCTHGPDLAPEGVDVTRRRSTEELMAATPTVYAHSVPGTPVAPIDGSGAVVCEGDGVTGKRVQALYVVASDKTDRFETIKATLGQYAINADRQYNASALQNGAARHLRFVTVGDGNGGCTLDLRKVVIDAAADDDFGTSVNALKAQGYNRSDRKYLMFVDANVYCGIGGIYRDSQSGQANINNGSYAQYGRADNGCWDYAEAHELMHNLGGVQTDAPNATPNFHCTDEYDDMCYDDDGSGPVVMRNICPTSFGDLFDCNDDDYFHAGTVPSGNYLATHWNTATSAFLINPTTAPGDTTPPAAPSGLTATGGAGSVALTWTANGESDLAGYRVLRNGTQIASLGKVTSYTDSGLPSGATYTYTVRAVDAAGNVSAGSAPATATTQSAPFSETLTGSFSKQATSRSITRTVAGGAASFVASGTITSKGRTTPASVTVRLTGPGYANAAWSGTNLSVSTPFTGAGNATWTISGASGAKYSLKLTYLR